MLLLSSPLTKSFAYQNKHICPACFAYFFWSLRISRRKHFNFAKCFSFSFILHLTSAISYELSKIIRQASYVQIPPFSYSLMTGKKKILNSLGQPDQHKILSLERCKVEFNALFLNWDFKSLGNYKTNIAERKEHWWYIGQKKILIWVALMKVFSHKYRYHDITVFTTSVLKTGRRILSSPLKKEPLEY